MTDRPGQDIAREVIQRERDALERLRTSIGPSFDEALELLLACTGRVIVCGMGKSGLVGRKIAATFVSTGTPSGFLHPAEGPHGDVGTVTSRDLVLAISNTGTTREVTDLVPVIREIGASVIALTSSPNSPLARAADLALCWGELEEADPLQLVPPVSTTVTMALGDALTVALMERRGFDPASYRLFHPGGQIGSKLRLRVRDLLRGTFTNPTVPTTATFAEALDVVTHAALGGVSVIDADGRLVGLLTDGDIRRALQTPFSTSADLLGRPVPELMTADPTVGHPEMLAIDALKVMEKHQPRPIDKLPVVDGAWKAVGLLHVHMLVQAGLTTDRDV